MSEKIWWASALQWALWGAAMTVTMRWLERTRLKRRGEMQPGTLAHPPSTLIVGAICFIFFAGIAVISNVQSNATTTWWTTAIFVGFALLSIPMISSYFIDRHDVSETGLIYTTMFGARKQMRWEDVSIIRYAHFMKWFQIRSTSGQMARLSVMLTGLPEFARLALDHVAVDAIPPETRSILQATEDGHPPSMWN